MKIKLTYLGLENLTNFLSLVIFVGWRSLVRQVVNKSKLSIWVHTGNVSATKAKFPRYRSENMVWFFPIYMKESGFYASVLCCGLLCSWAVLQAQLSPVNSLSRSLTTGWVPLNSYLSCSLQAHCISCSWKSQVFACTQVPKTIGIYKCVHSNLQIRVRWLQICFQLYNLVLKN